MQLAIRCALALALCGAASAQQPIFKSTMPDGRVIYGEKPEPGAKRVDKVEAPAPKSGLGGLTADEKARAEQLSRQRALDNAAAASRQREIDEARKQLKAAEAARDAGKEPLPGERLGLVGGGTRLTDTYHERQKNLEAAVEAARKRLQAAESR